jgi:hypothetical protein
MAASGLLRPMRRLLVVIGVAIAVVGFVLSFVPIFNGPSEDLTPAHPTAAFNATTTLSIAPVWTVGLSWSSNQKVSLLVVICQSVSQSATVGHSACPNASYTVLNGTSGYSTFSVPLHGTLLVGIVSAPGHGLSVEVQSRPTLLSIGALLVVGGGVIIAVGFVPRRRQRLSPPGASEPQQGPGF